MNVNDLYEHQQKYYNALVAKKNEKGHFKSLVCIPTGGGKTRLAITYLGNNHLNNNEKVIWIAHSKFLLNQANDVFLSLGYDKKEIICIHSEASNFSSIQNNHRIIITSFQSLISYKSKNNDLSSLLGDNAVVVVDEAHHIVAESFMESIASYSTNKTVLGLTATPIRSKFNDSLKLYDYFEDDLEVKIHMAQLIKEGVLVKPYFEEVDYNLYDNDISSIDSMEDSLTNASNYNLLILNQYLGDSARYGKTVVFAINIKHAETLYSIFKTNFGDNVNIVHSERSDSNEQFERFKNNPNGILININILNEGVDIPDIKTIFLAKPLNSKIAVTQIIGRALRKPKNSNKNEAYIVNFAVKNVGRKLLLVTPKLRYNLYVAQWQGQESVDIIEQEEAQIGILEKVVENLKLKNQKSATCSFFNVFVVGYYTILVDDSTDLIFPVTFNEYMRIEKYRKKTSNTFPKSFFLMEDEVEFKNKIDSDCKIIFDYYDEQLFELISCLEVKSKELYKEKIEQKLTVKQIYAKIEELYNGLDKDIVDYLRRVSANSLQIFSTLIRLQFVQYKFTKMEES